MRPASTRSSLIHGAPIHAGSVRPLPRTTAPSAPTAVEATRSPWFTRPVTATLRTGHPTARLVWTGDFANYSGDFWATVAGEPMPTAAAANSWCDAQALDADHCWGGPAHPLRWTGAIQCSALTGRSVVATGSSRSAMRGRRPRGALPQGEAGG